MSEQRRRGPMGGHGRMMSGEKAKDFKGSMAKLFRYMGRYKFRFILMFIFAVAGTVFSIVGPKILGKATTELFNGLVAKVNGTGEIDFGKIGMILLWTLGLYVLSACFSFVQGFVMSGISNDVTYNLRKDISKKINRLPLNYYESRTNGEILSRITNDVDTLQMSLNQSLTQLITSVTTLIGVFIMMLSINVWMTLAALLILPVSMFIIQAVMKHSQKYFQAQQNYLGAVNGQIEENFGGHDVVRVFNKENDVLDEFEKDNKKLYESAWKSQFFSGMMMPIMQFVGNLGYVMVALLGGVFVIKGSIEVGDIQSFFQYIRNFTQPIQQIAQVTNLLQSSAAASERVFEFLEEEEEVQQPEHPDLQYLYFCVVTDFGLLNAVNAADRTEEQKIRNYFRQQNALRELTDFFQAQSENLQKYHALLEYLKKPRRVESGVRNEEDFDLLYHLTAQHAFLYGCKTNPVYEENLR